MKSLLLFTDGSAHPTSRIGYGAYLAIPDLNANFQALETAVQLKRFEDTSSSQLEIETLIWALRATQPQTLTLYTDSQTIIGLPDRRERMEKQAYRSKAGTPLNHAELYQEFFALTDPLEYTLVKVKGHQRSHQKSPIDHLFLARRPRISTGASGGIDQRMMPLKYLSGYAPELQQQIQHMIEQDSLKTFLEKKHPELHEIRNDAALLTYVNTLKNRYMKKAPPLSKIVYDNKIHVIHGALGTHSYVSRNQGGKLKTKNEIRIGAVFKNVPEALLKMIVVHELAHLKEKEHNKPFYKLCEHMLPDYHQLEFEMRLYLTQLEESRQ